MPGYNKRVIVRRYGARKRRRTQYRPLSTASAAAVVGRALRGRVYVPRIHTFTRTYVSSAAVTNANTFVAYPFSFSLSSLVNYSEFTSLFDQYRINFVDVTVIFNRTSASTLPSTDEQNQLPFLHRATDLDDADTFTLNDLVQYGDYRVDRLDRVLRWRVYPRPCLAAYQGAFTGYTTTGRAWIDQASPGVLHYGLKVGLSMNQAPAATATIGQITFFFKYNMSFKNTR